MAISYYRETLNNTHPQWWRDPGLRINVLHCIGCCFCVFYLGYDQSLLTGLQAIPQWDAFFDRPRGNKLGLIAASLFLPSIPSAFVGDFLAYRYGRRVAVWFGSVLIIIGALVNGFAHNLGMFIGGRIILGTGGGITKVGAPALLQEIAHPRMRAVLGSIYYPFYFSGSTVSAWLCYGGLSMPGNWSWRIPVIFQLVGPILVISMTATAPESPRWLIKAGKTEQAHAVLTKYHANGDKDDPLVNQTFREISQALALEASLPKSRYRDFFLTPGNRRRVIVAISLALGTNWVGNGIISYYLTPVLRNVGFTNPIQISGINAGLSMFNLVIALFAGFNVERFGRRPLFLTSIVGMLLSYACITGIAAGFAKTQQRSIGIALLPFLFFFYGFYDIAWTPLPYSYTTEILPYNLRTKGLAIFTAWQNVGNAFNQFVNPVALAAIQWRYYAVYIGILAFYLVFAYFMYPETKGRTIEEVSVLFDHGRTGKRDAEDAQLANMPGRPDETHPSTNGDGEKAEVYHHENRELRV